MPTSANVEFYARIVQASSIRRTLARVSQEIIAQAHDESSEISVILEEAERRIFEISDRHQTGTYLTAKEIVKQTFDAIEKHYHSKTEYTGIPSGFKDLDQLTMGFQNSEFIVIGARPSVGKTAFALTIAAHMAIKQKIPVGFFSLGNVGHGHHAAPAVHGGPPGFPAHAHRHAQPRGFQQDHGCVRQALRGPPVHQRLP